MKKSAIISPCQRYRYYLSRAWDYSLPVVNFIMLNPSTADADVDDNTIRRCVSFAKGFGFGMLTVTNLYAYRATDPHDLKQAGYQVGADNDEWIRTAAFNAAANRGLVVCAWGANAIVDRVREVRELLYWQPVEVYHLGLTTGSGQPRHPLYLKTDTRLQRFNV
jgi:hypothetical protein